MGELASTWDRRAPMDAQDWLVMHEPRPLSATLTDSFTRCAHRSAFDVRAVLTPEDPAGCLPAALGEPLARTQLEADLHELVPRFLYQTGCSSVFARLKVIDHDGCRRFHRDYIRLRTVVTYVGPATQWLDEDNLRREHLDDEGDVDVVNRRLVISWSRVNQASPGDRLWLRGTEAGPGIVHRSPSIQGTGVRRVVLKLDDRAIPSV